jgi:hypothetical protein
MEGILTLSKISKLREDRRWHPYTKGAFLLFSNKITTDSNSPRSLVQVRTSNKLVLGFCDPFRKLGP